MVTGPKKKTEKTKLGLYVNAQLKWELQAMAEAEGRSMNRMIERALTKWVQSRTKKEAA
jgi:predicted HicB family RNase H-like nuclease